MSKEQLVTSIETAKPPPYIASVLTPEESIDEWKKLLPTAKKSNFMFMSAPGGKKLGEPFEELKPSLIRANNVKFGVGKYDSMFPVFAPSILPPYLRWESKEQKKDAREQREITKAARSELEENGVKIYKTKAQGISHNLVGFADQPHSKLAKFSLKDGRVITYFPEFNLDSSSFNALNSALRFEESREQAEQSNSIANVVELYMEKAYKNDPFKDYEEKITDDLLFMADGGRPGRSIIKGKATGLVKERDTQDVFFASQLVPAGSVLDGMIEKAKEEKHVTVVLSDDCRPKPNGQQLDIAAFHWRTRRLENFHVVYSQKKVHSKLLLVNSGIRAIKGEGEEKPQLMIQASGKNMKGIASSNNLHPAGYMVGTGETGLLIKDQELLNDMRNRVVDMVNENEISLQEPVGQYSPLCIVQ